MMRLVRISIVQSPADKRATECLDVVSRAASNDGTLLYGCILEAQKVGHRKQAIQSFQKLVAEENRRSPDGLHFPALLRYLLQSSKVQD
jgi:hypothetical protein